MESKSNKFLIGLICIILGIYFISSQYFSLKMGNTVMFVLAGALILLYHTKRKAWALVLGVIIYVLWMFKMFPHLGGSILMAMVFLVPGITFLVLYFSKYRNPFLVIGSIFTWFGIFIFLTCIPKLNINGSAIFFICMGAAFLTMYLINKYEMGKWTIIFSIILMMLGIMRLFGSPFNIIFKTIPSVMPIILIGLGIIIIAKTFLNKKQ